MEYKDVEIYQTPAEIAILREQLHSVKYIRGSVVEVGVYEGATALIIREELPLKDLYLFDTFEGFPDCLHETDAASYFVGDCKAPLEGVRKLLAGKKVHIVKGIFPKTASVLKGKFSFVHIDVDIYKSTIDALDYFKTRMNKGGKILIHDYPAHGGVKLAVEESGLDVEILGGRQGVWKT